MKAISTLSDTIIASGFTKCNKHNTVGKTSDFNLQNIYSIITREALSWAPPCREIQEGYGESGTSTVIYPTSLHRTDSARGHAQVIIHLTNSLPLKQAFAKKCPSALVYTAECTASK